MAWHVFIMRDYFPPMSLPSVTNRKGDSPHFGMTRACHKHASTYTTSLAAVPTIYRSYALSRYCRYCRYCRAASGFTVVGTKRMADWRQTGRQTDRPGDWRLERAERAGRAGRARPGNPGYHAAAPMHLHGDRVAADPASQAGTNGELRWCDESGVSPVSPVL